MRAEFETRGADEIADVLDDEQIELGEVELIERAVQHDRVEVALAPGVDLDGGSRAGRGGAVRVNGGGNVAVHNRDAQFVFETRECLLDQLGLARAGRGHDVDGEHAHRIDAGAILLREAVIGVEDVFDDRDTLWHDKSPNYVGLFLTKA